MIDTCKVLKDTKTIAVVGISDKPYRDSGKIALFLKESGYNAVGVHPSLKTVNGIEVFKTLSEIPHKIDLVDVFLSSDKIDSIMNDVITIKPKYLWLQLGIRNDSAVKPAVDAGIIVIQDRCIAIELRNC